MWRSVEFPKNHRGTAPPGRHDVTLLKQWYVRALSTAGVDDGKSPGKLSPTAVAAAAAAAAGGGERAATAAGGPAAGAAAWVSRGESGSPRMRSSHSRSPRTAVDAAAASDDTRAGTDSAAAASDTAAAAPGARPSPAAAAASTAASTARVEDLRRVASVHVQASHELIRQVMVGPAGICRHNWA